MDLEFAGTIMYWCEGSKRDRDYRVEFVNSDPIMIRVFMKYLRLKGIDENRIRARISLHERDDATEFKEYWKGVTSLADSNFLAPSVRRTSPARFPLPHGTLTVRYDSIELLQRIKRDISDLAQKLLQV
jgi:hypothetical protein